MPSGPASVVGGFVPPPRFEDYREQFKDHVIMERRDGVLMLRFHTQDKALLWTPQIHRAIHQGVRVAVADPENDVIIITGTGDFWVAYGAMPDQPGGTAIPEDSLEQRANSSMEFLSVTASRCRRAWSTTRAFRRSRRSMGRDTTWTSGSCVTW